SRRAQLLRRPPSPSTTSVSHKASRLGGRGSPRTVPSAAFVCRLRSLGDGGGLVVWRITRQQERRAVVGLGTRRPSLTAGHPAVAGEIALEARLERAEDAGGVGERHLLTAGGSVRRRV